MDEEELVAGLPNDIVCTEILPRFPWHTRAAVQALSKPWRQAVQGMDPSLARRHTLPKLQGQLLLLCRSFTKLLVEEHGSSIWRQTPPLPDDTGRLSSKLNLLTLDGTTILAWTRAWAIKLDLCKGAPKWERVIDCPLGVCNMYDPWVFEGHKVYAMVRGDKPLHPQVLQVCDTRTGTTSTLATPEKLLHVWSVGDADRIQGTITGSRDIVEFSAATGEWKVLEDPTGAGRQFVDQCFIGLVDSRMTIHYNLSSRQWDKLENEPCWPRERDWLQVQPWSSNGSMFALSRKDRIITVWRGNIDHSRKKIAWLPVHSIQEASADVLPQLGIM